DPGAAQDHLDGAEVARGRLRPRRAKHPRNDSQNTRETTGQTHHPDNRHLARSRLKFGVAIFPTDYTIEPIALDRLAEERDFKSLFFPKHTHIPVSRSTPYPKNRKLPDYYSHTHNPFITLTTITTSTERLLLST